MSPILQDKLFDLLVNFVSILLAGGLITAIIEWRRHKRELATWQREDDLIQIDIPRSDLRVFLWEINEKTTDKDKLSIYENKLENTIRRLVVVAEFVIRNTTAAEIIVTSYGGDLLQIPAGDDLRSYYDLESYDLIDISEIGAIRLKPYATIPRAFIMHSDFGKDRVLHQAPTTLVIEVKTSSGKVIQGRSALKVIPKLSGIRLQDNEYFFEKYLEKFRDPDDEIPF